MQEALETAWDAVSGPRFKSYRALTVSELLKQLEKYQPELTSSIAPAIVWSERSSGYVIATSFLKDHAAYLSELSEIDKEGIRGEELDFDYIWEQATAYGPPPELKYLVSSLATAALRAASAQDYVWNEIDLILADLTHSSDQIILTQQQCLDLKRLSALLEATLDFHTKMLKSAFQSFLSQAESSHAKALQSLDMKTHQTLQADTTPQLEGYRSAAHLWQAATSLYLARSRLAIDHTMFEVEKALNLLPLFQRALSHLQEHGSLPTLKEPKVETLQPNLQLEQRINDLQKSLEVVVDTENKLDNNDLKRLTVSAITNGLKETASSTPSRTKKKKKKK
ncbi:hypothetical protein M231_03675 [Tremella mesenterica]|uniref:Uncharacterized protein n=1 Tax=Tremella mesenterica TaxID=5217 RepID=A0A4Q1BMJ1_TREME|nr:hypothetical protein M231_03675 [Tremella mesenterica]